MKKLILAMITVLGALGLALAGCAQPGSVEPTTPAVETGDETREPTREPTEEPTSAPEQGTTEGTKEATAEPTVETQEEPIEVVLWTTEDEESGLRFIRSLTEGYGSDHPGVSVEIVGMDAETLRENVLAADTTTRIPDLLWTGNDLVSPFVDAGALMPVDDVFELDTYVDSALAGVRLDDQTWGLPISSGGHLMLIYNENLLEEPPQTTDEMIEMGLERTTDGQYGLVYDQTDPFWLIPWLGGFTGRIFAGDTITPTLDTQEMVNALQFLYDIKVETPIVPDESDYEGAHLLFDRGRAAMIINGDWSLGGYRDTFGDALGVARIPQVSATGEWPHPYISGTYLMFPSQLEDDQAKLKTVVSFAEFVTNAENQAQLAIELDRLPTLREALEMPPIADDPVLKGSAEQMAVGRPEPAGARMRCVWDAMGPEMRAVLAGDKSPERAAADMQQVAESCIEDLGGN